MNNINQSNHGEPKIKWKKELKQSQEDRKSDGLYECVLVLAVQPRVQVIGGTAINFWTSNITSSI